MVIHSNKQLIDEVIKPLYDKGNMNHPCYVDLTTRLNSNPKSVADILTNYYLIKTISFHTEKFIVDTEQFWKAMKYAGLLQPTKVNGCKSIW